MEIEEISGCRCPRNPYSCPEGIRWNASPRNAVLRLTAVESTNRRMLQYKTYVKRIFSPLLVPRLFGGSYLSITECLTLSMEEDLFSAGGSTRWFGWKYSYRVSGVAIPVLKRWRFILPYMIESRSPLLNLIIHLPLIYILLVYWSIVFFKNISLIFFIKQKWGCICPFGDPIYLGRKLDF